MQAEITTIPELLIKARGNQTRVAGWISASRNTVKKYAFDVKAEKHIIVNNQLMVIHRGGIGGAIKRKSKVLAGAR
ncbi:protein ninH [Providencia stuartii]|uniref:protein ninH n=1 Tax=Providencia TaxID=586 RepID=UPI0018C96646|nr:MULTISPECIES: protein ninH [Providencia]QPN39474.1 protein ninH [Providencia sp. 2.29]WAZ79842.1 protein ninH [Providencia stuartii]WAZ82933.1 protein ninH [Providencia stuartii]